MSETVPAGAASTEAPAASAVVDPATTTQTAAPITDPALGGSLLGSETVVVGDGAKTPEQLAADEAAKTAAETKPDYSALKLPEGVKADDPLFADFAATAAEHNLTPEAAQAIIDKVLPGLHTQLQTLRDEPIRLATERLKGWEQAIHADAEIGGAKLNEVKTTVTRAMAQFGNPDEIKAALNETGAGSNPVLIKWLNKMASALGEGTAVTNGNPALPKPTLAERIYDNPTSKRVAA